MSRLSMRAITIALLLVPVALYLVVAPRAASASATFSFDVACDATSFVPQGPSSPTGPEYGASFVVQGLIYPPGTFDINGSQSGVLADGTAEFPELVVGSWTCRGWFIGDGLATVTGPFVATTQIYSFDGALGGSTLISEGLELIDVDVPFERAIIGGTNRFQGARGQTTQAAVGVNATGLFNFTFAFEI